jgi:hypothetical protein
MAHLPDDDRALIAFLKHYRPIPPPALEDREQQLMDAIAQAPLTPVPSKCLKPIVWAIPSAIAASLLLVWGASRHFSPTPQFAAQNDPALEAFLVDSWQGAIDTSASPTSTPVIEALYESDSPVSSP